MTVNCILELILPNLINKLINAIVPFYNHHNNLIDGYIIVQQFVNDICHNFTVQNNLIKNRIWKVIQLKQSALIWEEF